MKVALLQHLLYLLIAVQQGESELLDWVDEYGQGIRK